MHGSDEIAQAAVSYNSLLTSFKQVISQVLESAENVIQTATQLSASSQQITRGSQTQSEAAASTAASVEEMAVSITSVSENTNEVKMLSEQSLQKTRAGNMSTSEMINDVGIFVAADVDDSVVGFLCAFQSNFDHQSPVIRKMIEKSQLAEYQGKLINTYRTFYYGPVCIDRSQRGRGLLQALYEILKREIASRFDFGIAFVAKNNVRSLRAHEEKLRMTRVGDFEVAGKSYDLLVFEVFP